MPVVKMPDGVNVRFDDDMTNEQIREIILKKFPDIEKQKIDVNKLSAKDVMSDDGLNSNPTSKLDLMWAFANLMPDSVAKNQVDQVIVAARAIKNTDYKRLAPEAAKSIGRQTSDLVINRMVGSNIEKIGVLLKDNETKPDDFPKGSIMYHKTQFRDTIANGLIGYGKHIRSLSERLNNSDILKADEELFEGSFTENPNLHKAVDLAMSGVSSLVGMYSVSKYVNPAVGLFLFSGADADDIFWEALEAGKSKEKSLGLWAIATAGTAVAEKFGAEKVFGMKFGKEGMIKIVDSAKKTSHKIFEGMMAEGAEELTQNTFQNLVKKVGYNEAQDIFENGIESFAGGFLGGGLVSSFNYGYQAFKDKSNKAGINEQEQEKILNAIAQNIANKPNILEAPLQENMKKTYDSFEKMIEKLGDTPEAMRLRETKQALDEGYQKYFEQLKEYMPEEQAKANAALIRSAALFFADLDGVSVKDWFEQKSPQIMRMDNLETQAKEFIDNLAPTKLTIDENEINLFDALKNPDIVKKYSKKDERQSLLQFIRSRGGVKDVGGDLKAMDLRKQMPGLINNKSGQSLDDVALSAWESGYFVGNERPTVNDLLDAIRDESMGKKRYAEEKEEGIADYVDNLAEQLDMLGIDYANMSAQEAERAYNQAVEEYNAQREQAEQKESEYFEDIPFFQEEVYKEDGKADINSPEFKTWSNNAPFYEANKAEEHKFKTGKPLVAEVFHGTQRADRVGSVFLPSRATSGPMAFSTDTRSAAEGYANTKRDTSIYNETEGDFHKYFKVKIPNYNAVTLDRLWAILPYSKKQEMREKAPHITTDENGENIIYDENEKNGNGGYNAQYHGNNALEALVDAWMMSGSLWGEEEKFKQVMELAGLGEYEIQYVDPNAIYPKVYELYVEMQKPLVSYDVPKKVIDALDKASKKQSRDVAGVGTDFWDKNTRDPIAWMDALKDGDAYVWTSIPDWVTNTLKKMGYDGIVDTGGKGGGTEHNVFIPFTSTQYKSVYNRGTFSKENPDIFYQSAFAGSRVDYDRPSLEAIGSGEGHAAHGWGLYYALNRDVAEYYRETLAKPDISYEYDGDAKLTNAEIRIIGQYGLNKAIQMAERQLDLKIAQGYSESDIEEQKAIVEKLKSVNENDIKKIVKENKGQVHEVDIPENPYLLDEQKTLGEQSPLVKKALREVAKQVGVKWDNRYDNGKYIYDNIANVLGSQKAASQMLEKHGIKGITYDGRQDGRCFVIFNPADVKVIQKFYQGENNPLGAYSNRIIYLNKTANASTLPHELAHFWSDELRQSKSLRAKEILKQADKWQESEFQRKYSIKEENGKYIVTDKAGQTIYDRMGEGFETVDKAKAYAKEELFARGFEQYIREGKSPNQTLRVVFRNFFNWLKKIYHDMMALDIKLSNPMRNLYAEILGSTKIDTFLSQDAEQFIEARKEAGQERVKQVQEIIDQAINTPKKTAWQRVKQAYQDFDFSKTWTDTIVPLSTRAKRIAPTFRNTLRRYMFDLLNDRRKNYEELAPMLKKWKEFSPDDSVAFDLALKNNVPEIRDELLKKYDAVEDFGKVKKILEKIYIEAGNAGMDVGYIEDYFPRKVKDVNGLLAYLQGTDEWSNFEQARKREDPGNKFDAEEQAEFIDKFLRGIVRADPSSYKYSSEKNRKLNTIDNGINQFYEGSMQALINYVDGMTARIAVMKFFGRNDNNVDDSIGAFIGYMLDTNQIKASQVDEVKNILTAVFKSRGVSTKWLKGARDIAYLYTMGGVNTAITQIDDIFVSMYKSGVLNTIQSLKEGSKITKRDIGLDSIAAEFMDGSGTSKAVNWVFKKNGIDFIDGMGKNALLNGVLKKAQKMSDEELTSYLAPIMEEETENTLNDIRAGELSDNVRFFLFNELSDMQPISLLEMPETYNTGGNRRIFYMLKSFMLKRIDTLRNECFDKIRSGDKAERVEGLRNLYRLTLLMMIGGATKDLLIDLMYGRVIDLKDTVVNNLLGMVGISKYNIYQVREEGLGHTLAIFAFPPLFQVAEDLSGDVNKMIDGKRELKDFEVFKGLPIIGRFYYWWLGGGKTKQEKKRRKKR